MLGLGYPNTVCTVAHQNIDADQIGFRLARGNHDCPITHGLKPGAIDISPRVVRWLYIPIRNTFLKFVYIMFHNCFEVVGVLKDPMLPARAVTFCDDFIYSRKIRRDI